MACCLILPILLEVILLIGIVCAFRDANKE